MIAIDVFLWQLPGLTILNTRSFKYTSYGPTLLHSLAPMACFSTIPCWNCERFTGPSQKSADYRYRHRKMVDDMNLRRFFAADVSWRLKQK